MNKLCQTMAPDGQPLQLIRLRNDSGLQLELMDWGATWLSCLVPLTDGNQREILLGCSLPEDYFRQNAWLGATVGRYANRIADSRISRTGQTFQLQANQGQHQLHGGPEGFDRRRWAIFEHSQEHVKFGLLSPDGDQGFPGKLNAQVSYTLREGGIDMLYCASVNQACPVCLTQHSYFNLDGAMTDIRRHSLQINAAQYAPVDAQMIPQGNLDNVAGSGFDFRQPKLIGTDFLRDTQQKLAGGYDHAWLLDQDCQAMTKPAAILASADKRLEMALYTTMPAIQFYSGNHLAGTPARDGQTYAAQQGLALETQFLPDSPNHPEWPQPSCWLQPGETYRHTTRLVFSSF